MSDKLIVSKSLLKNVLWEVNAGRTESAYDALGELVRNSEEVIRLSRIPFCYGWINQDMLIHQFDTYEDAEYWTKKNALDVSKIARIYIEEKGE